MLTHYSKNTSQEFTTFKGTRLSKADLGYYDICCFPGIIWSIFCFKRIRKQTKTLLVNSNSVDIKGSSVSLKILHLPICTFYINDKQIFNERLYYATKLSCMTIIGKKNYTYLNRKMSLYVHTKAYITLYFHIFVSLSIKY